MYRVRGEILGTLSNEGVSCVPCPVFVKENHAPSGEHQQTEGVFPTVPKNELGNPSHTARNANVFPLPEVTSEQFGDLLSSEHGNTEAGVSSREIGMCHE